ncbi:5-deoxy-glucuronate isomerase [Aureimonas sp. AU12]|uniref:5-deoxy-glucuronate isomerase n=1 Tax=Aureimonas sp. AU12 TaxID=1638161 RepID=UPI0007855526|nr:5-deoxy-glucuronate isomerase [Aureimonas sp. AU12]
MSKLKLRPRGRTGLVHEVTPQSAGWRYVGFAVHALEDGARVAAETGETEVCLVLVSGRARFTVDGRDFGEMGGRASPFEGAPDALYVPMGARWEAVAVGAVELAVCSAPGAPGFGPRAIPAGTHPQKARGQGTNTRHVTNIMPEDDGAAHSLLVVEVITPGGHTSSYPPHKHDQDDLPAESYLEETYYHRFNPQQGFAFQRVYTDRDEASGERALDEAIAVEDGDVVLVPRGYHPVAAIHGYDGYYLNVMAGPSRAWKFHNAPEHQWLFTGV